MTERCDEALILSVKFGHRYDANDAFHDCFSIFVQSLQIWVKQRRNFEIMGQQFKRDARKKCLKMAEGFEERLQVHHSIMTDSTGTMFVVTR